MVSGAITYNGSSSRLSPDSLLVDQNHEEPRWLGLVAPNRGTRKCSVLDACQYLFRSYPVFPGPIT